jgi:hypothetical protein
MICKGVKCGFKVADVFLAHHKDTEATEGSIISLAGRPQCNILFIIRGRRRPGKNAIAFGEWHFSPRVLGGYGLHVKESSLCALCVSVVNSRAMRAHNIRISNKGQKSTFLLRAGRKAKRS